MNHDQIRHLRSLIYILNLEEYNLQEYTFLGS